MKRARQSQFSGLRRSRKPGPQHSLQKRIRQLGSAGRDEIFFTAALVTNRLEVRKVLQSSQLCIGLLKDVRTRSLCGSEELCGQEHGGERNAAHVSSGTCSKSGSIKNRLGCALQTITTRCPFSHSDKTNATQYVCSAKPDQKRAGSHVLWCGVMSGRPMALVGLPQPCQVEPRIGLDTCGNGRLLLDARAPSIWRERSQSMRHPGVCESTRQRSIMAPGPRQPFSACSLAKTCAGNNKECPT